MSSRLGVIERAREDASFLAKASVNVPMGTDLSLALSNWARLSVPYIADWCVIELFMPNGMLRRLAVAFRYAGGEHQARLLRTEQDLEALPPALKTAISEQRVFLEDPVISRWISSSFAAIQPTGILVVPMKNGTRSVGLITWLVSDPTRRISSDRVAVAEEFAARVAASLENLNAYRVSQNAVRSREEFISVASHELKTPLTVLVLQLQLLRQCLTDNDDERVPARVLRPHFNSVERATERLSETIHRLLDLTQIRSGQLSLSCSRVDLREIVREVANSLKATLNNAHCDLELKLGEEAVGNWDRFRLGQVVMNLISNAAKYAPGASITVELQKSDSYAIVAVSDRGRGIAPADQEMLFEQFSRAKKTQQASGLGLGLYICRNIVELHGGRIWVESREGEGAKFSIQLPIEF